MFLWSGVGYLTTAEDDMSIKLTVEIRWGKRRLALSITI